MKVNIRDIAGVVPTLGILAFVGLYCYSSTLYPGGSQADLTSVGFDWMNNYWCNLLNNRAMNGELNPAKPFAILAMTMLCVSLFTFFVQFAIKLATSDFWKRSIQVFGGLSMFCAILISSQHHDLMTVLSSIFGVFAVIGIMWELNKSKLNAFKLTGIMCVILLVANNYIYYSGHLIEHLPIIQKITFILILSWIAGLNIRLRNEKMLQ